MPQLDMALATLAIQDAPCARYGRRELPRVTAREAIAFLSSWMALAVVLARSSYSFSMLPSYPGLDTRSRLRLRLSRLDRSGAMAPMDSLPNRFLRTAACWTLSSLLMLSRTIRMVPLASFCMLAATWVESRPSSSKAALCFW